MSELPEEGPVTRVLFRVWPDGGIVALFPDEAATEHSYHCSSYVLCGGHGSANTHAVINATRPARGEEAAEIRTELERLGYRLQEVKRVGHTSLTRRIKQIRAYQAAPGK